MPLLASIHFLPARSVPVAPSANGSGQINQCGELTLRMPYVLACATRFLRLAGPHPLAYALLARLPAPEQRSGNVFAMPVRGTVAAAFLEPPQPIKSPAFALVISRRPRGAAPWHRVATQGILHNSSTISRTPP